MRKWNAGTQEMEFGDHLEKADQGIVRETLFSWF
jgi:hypothetical protein